MPDNEMLNPRFQPVEYMRFAKGAMRGARIALTVSGMGAPPAEWLGDPKALLDLTDTGASGTRFLRERIAARTRVQADEVFVTPGASSAIHLAAAALCGPSRDALCESPGYPPLWLEPEFFGARVRFVERELDTGYALEPDDVAEALAAAREPSILFFTNLHNPTGTLIPEGDLVKICRAALDAGARPVCCELYGDFLGPRRPRAVAELVKGAVSIGSMTKAFGLGALRVGWILCQDLDFLERIELLFDHLDVNCAMPSLRAAAAALDASARFEARALETAAAGRAVFDAWAEKERRLHTVRWAAPAGGIIAFPRILGVDDTKALARRVREKHGVQLTPGEYFRSPGSLRIGFGGDPALTKEGLDALSKELSR
jgi:aspartate/methionine/tyrosine aminotransferase